MWVVLRPPKAKLRLPAACRLARTSGRHRGCFPFEFRSLRKKATASFSGYSEMSFRNGVSHKRDRLKRPDKGIWGARVRASRRGEAQSETLRKRREYFSHCRILC